MSKREDRIQKLVELLISSETVHLKDAAQLLDVSEMTIRRDISLSQTSPINLLGGYLVLSSGDKDTSQYFISDQKDRNIDEKEHIGKIAASFIKENDTLFFDCGTSIPFIIKHIPSNLTFTAVCYSINVFLELKKHKNCQIILCGGLFSIDNAIFTPLGEQTPLDMICPNKAFISAAGIDFKGVTCFNFNEVSWKIKAMQRSASTLLVADNSKFNQLRSAYIAPLAEFDILITDKIDENYQTYCHKNNITLYT